MTNAKADLARLEATFQRRLDAAVAVTDDLNTFANRLVDAITAALDYIAAVKQMLTIPATTGHTPKEMN